MGRNVVEAPGLFWPQFSLSKQWSFFSGTVYPAMGHEQSVQESELRGTGLNLQSAESGELWPDRHSNSRRFSDVGTAQPNHLLVFRLEW